MPLRQNKHISDLPPPTLDLETLLGMLVIGIAAFSADFTNKTNQRDSDRTGRDAKPLSQKLLNALMLGGKKSLIVWHSVNSYLTGKRLLPCGLSLVSAPQGPMLKALNLIPQPDSQADALPPCSSWCPNCETVSNQVRNIPEALHACILTALCMLLPCLHQAELAASSIARSLSTRLRSERFSSPLASAIVAELRAEIVSPMPPLPPQQPTCSSSQVPARYPPAPLTSLLAAGLWHSNVMQPGAPGGLAGFLCPGAESPGPCRSACSTNGSWRRGRPEPGTGPALHSDAHRDALTRCQPTAADVGAVGEKAAVVRKKITGQSAGEPAWWHRLYCRSRPQ